MKLITRKYFPLILIFGLISLFGDLIYEGARSINGQYLLLLGATSSIIGFFFGLGEFLSNFLRFIFGFIADKTKHYWFFIILGYILLIFIPLISLTNSWEIVIVFILFERIGKAIRNPARDTIVSVISKDIGFSFGIIELLDQIGALLGPIIIALILVFLNTNEISKYKTAYSILIFPFFILIFLLFFSYTHSKKIKIKKEERKKEKISKVFWYYSLFVFFTSIGFIHFAILGYHFKLNNIISDYLIVLLYSLAMISDAIISPIIGKVYDKLKERKINFTKILYVIPILSIFIPILIFSNIFELIVVSIILYGLVLGMQETIMRAVIADITPISKRGFAYGIFSFIFGISIFIGSSIIGFLYEISMEMIITFIIFSQIFSLLFLTLTNRSIQKII